MTFRGKHVWTDWRLDTGGSQSWHRLQQLAFPLALWPQELHLIKTGGTQSQATLTIEVLY